MDDLSLLLNASDDGCILNGSKMNHLFYADNAVLLAPSPAVLQNLLNVCNLYAHNYELMYNRKKTVTMCFKPKFLRNIQVPKFQLDCEKLKDVTVHKYLWCFIHNQLCDNDDIKRQMRSTYARGNSIIKRFRHYTDDVKVNCLSPIVVRNTFSYFGK